MVHAVKDDQIMMRGGKPHVLYPGLLELAHAKGLKKTETELKQIPTEENNHTAIVHARCYFEDINDATGEVVEKQFDGIGDAAPYNVSGEMKKCLIRMAETRAKGRAMRDGVNISAAFDETE